MIKRILKFLKLKKKMFLLNRVCNNFCGCDTCPFTQTKNVSTCIVCHERSKIYGELLNVWDK